MKDGRDLKVGPKKVAMNSQVSEAVKIEQDAKVPKLAQNEQTSKSTTKTQQKPKSTKSSQRNTNSSDEVEPKSAEVGAKCIHCSKESTLIRNVSSSPDNSEVKKEVTLHETNASSCKVKCEVDPKLVRNKSDKHIFKSENIDIRDACLDNAKNGPGPTSSGPQRRRT